MPGFESYFADLTARDREQVWGATLPTDARPEASVFVAGQITDDPSTVLVLPGIDFRDVELEATCNWFEAHTPPATT